MLPPMLQCLVFGVLIVQARAIGRLHEGSTREAESLKLRRTLLEGNATSSTGECNSERKRDWFGGDLLENPLSLESWKKCCSACQDNPDCVGWTYRTTYLHCYLKKRLVNDQPCPDCVRGKLHRSVQVVSNLNAKCNSQTSVDWKGGNIYKTPFNIDDPGVCCEYCLKDPACKAWVWRKENKHCWLKNVINDPSACGECTGGILDDDVKVDTSLPVDFIERCRYDGERVAVAVAAGACSALENRCPPAAESFELKEADAVEAPNGEVETIRANEAILEEAFDQVLTQSCIAVFEESCKRNAQGKAEIHYQTCASILNYGPEYPTRRCTGVSRALRIFSNQVEYFCSFNSTLAAIPAE